MGYEKKGRPYTSGLNQKEKVDEGNKKYHALFEQSLDMICLHDLDGRIVEVNRQAAARTGYSQGELSKMTVFDFLYDPAKSADLKEIWEKCPVDGEPLFIESKNRRKDGSASRVEIKAVKIIADSAAVMAALVRDIDEQRSVEDALQHQFEFEKMVSEISSVFVRTPTSRIDEAIGHALKVSGELFSADRSYICKFSDDYRYIYSTHEWCADGIFSVHERNQGLPAAALPWWTEKLKTEDCVYIPDVGAMPPEAAKDREDFLIEEIKSILTIPLVKENKTIGYFGFDAVTEHRQWSEKQVDLLRVLAEIIASAILKSEAEEALKESEKRYRDILDTMEEGYYETDLSGTIVYCNDAASRLFGYEPGELVGISYEKLYKEPKKAFNTFHKVFSTGKPDRGLILEMLRKDGSSGYGELSISLRMDKEGSVVGFKGIGKDVTENIEHQNRLEYLSLHDQLTDSYNRAFFEAELKRLNNSRQFPVTVISADLDGLKLINDTMGHDAGDRLLKNSATILKDSLRESDILARVDGDEFSAILPFTGREAGEAVIKRIRKNIKRYNLHNPDRPMGISVGVATADTSEVGLKELYRRADDLMYRDKLYRSSSNRNRIVKSLLAALGERDYITEGHASRLEKLCLAIGERVNLTSHQLADLALLAQVHDLGKVGVPDQILFKPGPLTEEEWAIMRGHPEKGYRIASSSPDLSGVADLILKHHERSDGSGYPLGLKNNSIPVECRILAIVDAYDAMTNKRPYNQVKTTQEAITEIENNAGTQFDAELVRVFIDILNEQPINTGQE